MSFWPIVVRPPQRPSLSARSFGDRVFFCRSALAGLLRRLERWFWTLLRHINQRLLGDVCGLVNR
jgi:hypothetical protein